MIVAECLKGGSYQELQYGIFEKENTLCSLALYYCERCTTYFQNCTKSDAKCEELVHNIAFEKYRLDILELSGKH